MKWFGKLGIIFASTLSLLLWTPSNPTLSAAATEVKKTTTVKTDLDDKIGEPNAKFDVNKMSCPTSIPQHRRYKDTSKGRRSRLPM